MPGFDFDMAFAVDELSAGAARLFATLGHGWARRDEGAGARFAVTLASGHTVHLHVGPLPPERQTSAVFAPRALLTAHSDDASAAEVDVLRQAIIRAFLRVMG